MSTVLWANVLIAGAVKSDQTDHLALYKHAGKLNAITNALKLQPFKAICDTTDRRINMGTEELPAGMRSTNELMAAQGTWMSADAAISFLQELRDHIADNNVRFGLLSNQQPEVLAELDEVLAFVKTESPRAEKFNFSVVM